MRWSSVTLGDLMAKGQLQLQTGPFGTQLKASDYVAEGVPVINVRNIGYGNLKEDKLEFVPPNTSERLNRHHLAEGDIVFGRKGAVDRHLLVSDRQTGWLQGSDCIRLRVIGPKVNARYLSYWFLREAHKEWILTQCSNKATMASLNQDVIARIPFRCPPESVQRDVVEILSTYDNLVEGNRRRIQLLEESARLLYREWFIHLRFPGHEHVKAIQGLPIGWSRRTYDEICHSIGGGTPSSGVSEYWNGDITWVTPSDITANDCLYLLDSSRKITEAGLANSSAKMLPADAILMTSRASIGYFALANRPVCTNQGFIAVVPKVAGSRYYLLFEMMTRVEEFRSRASGSTFKELSKGTLRELSVVWPTADLLASYDSVVAPTIAQIQALAVMNSKLAQARDLLLPHLMSGAIAV